MTKTSPFLLVALMLMVPACNDRNTSSNPPAPNQNTVATAPPQQNPHAQDGNSNLPAGHPPLNSAGGANPGAMAQAPAQDPNAPKPIEWKLPEGWSVSPQQRSMRFATIMTPDNLEAQVNVFPGTVGGTLANINRWRQQVNADPITEADLDKTTQKMQINGKEAIFTDITGKDGRMLAAIVPGGEQLWFFKMAGPADQIEKNKQGFLSLLQSVKVNPQAQ